MHIAIFNPAELQFLALNLEHFNIHVQCKHLHSYIALTTVKTVNKTGTGIGTKIGSRTGTGTLIIGKIYDSRTDQNSNLKHCGSTVHPVMNFLIVYHF